MQKEKLGDMELLVLRPAKAAKPREKTLGILYLKNHAEDLGCNEDQLMVGGESAGGELTAVLCMYAREHYTAQQDISRIARDCDE